MRVKEFINLGPKDAKPGAPTDKQKLDALDNQDLRAGPPYNPKDKERVKDMQTKLTDLGYYIGPMGIDGKYGPYTTAGLAAFKKDYQINTDKATFTTSDKETLNKVATGQIPKVKPSEAPGLDVGKGETSRAVGITSEAKQALEFFIRKGWSPEQAAGIVGNLQMESGAYLNPKALGVERNGTKAVGIAQWHPDRAKRFEKVMGKKVLQSSLEDQLEFVDWELKNMQNLPPYYAGDRLRRAKSAEEAAYIVDKYYERSSGEHRQRRMDNALALAQQKASTA